MARAWLFPGQGSQRRGMGRDVLERYPALVDRASDLLGWDVRAQICDGAEPGLRSTVHVQPAMFLVSALSALARLDAGERPDYLAGHSLGEYAALYAAGSFDLDTGLELVRERGRLMGRADGGAMLAVVDAPLGRVTDVLLEPEFAEVDVANRNSATQLVLAGNAAVLAALAETLRARGIGRTVPLRVSAAFHSRQMAEAAKDFAEILARHELRAPNLPVLANVTAQPYPPDGVAELLVRQIDGTVLWWETMSRLHEAGVDDVVELGPGSVASDLFAAAGAAPFITPPEERPAVTALTPEQLGSAEFRRDYGLRYAYLAGAMYRGIASVELVLRLGRSGLMGFFGSGGLDPDEVEQAVSRLTADLGNGGRFGVNLLASPDDPSREMATVEVLLRHGVRHVEAAAFVQVTPAVVTFRFTGARIGADGMARACRHVVAKVSRPEVAEAFLSPPPGAMLDALVAAGRLNADEAAAARLLPVAGDLCAEADSGGHTDGASPFALLPAMTRLRDTMMARHAYATRVRVGAAGGIGGPESAAAAFVLGADFVVTGSVNQCTPEAGTSDAVKDLLASIDVQDTTYAPAGDMFELGARVQVVRRGTLFAARANRLHQVYRQVGGIEEIDPETRATIEDRYFRRTLDSIWDDLQRTRPAAELDRARRNGKVRMAMIFRWYFGYSTRAAMDGTGERADYQVHCGPAMGAFNRTVEGTELQPWRARHVDDIAELIMAGAAAVLEPIARGLSR